MERSDRQLSFLVAMFEGGGNIPLILPIVSRLVARGNRVKVVAGARRMSRCLLKFGGDPGVFQVRV